MGRKWLQRACFVAALACGCGTVIADDRAEYYRRAAARDARLFAELDRDRDGALARDEVQGDLTLGPRFDDMDIDRDGVVTRTELDRYIGQRYGVR